MRRKLFAFMAGAITMAAAACGPLHPDPPPPAAPPGDAYKTGGYNRFNPNAGQEDKGGGEKSPGRVVYDNLDCSKCHSVEAMAGGPRGGGPGGSPPDGAGPGGPGGPRGGGPGGPGGPGGGGRGGPNLSKVGGKHDKDWIMAHIRDAKTHNPMSKMPPYPEDKISSKDLETLGEFLSGLK